jgi:hypothetical protein
LPIGGKSHCAEIIGGPTALSRSADQRRWFLGKRNPRVAKLTTGSICGLKRRQDVEGWEAVEDGEQEADHGCVLD